jgi:hypothetical protein
MYPAAPAGTQVAGDLHWNLLAAVQGGYPGSMSQTRITPDLAFFDRATLRDAMSVILTAQDSTTEHRWATETPYLTDLISRTARLSADSLVLDYGCGVGRMAKALIELRDVFRQRSRGKLPAEHTTQWISHNPSWAIFRRA